MTAPDVIQSLVDLFDTNRDQLVLPSYNETQIRREFIDPFFNALGWDIDNKQGTAEAYKDVVHEDAIKIGSATKAPDYSFVISIIQLLHMSRDIYVRVTYRVPWALIRIGAEVTESPPTGRSHGVSTFSRIARPSCWDDNDEYRHLLRSGKRIGINQSDFADHGEGR
jgi:hypothetical protein